MIPQGAQYEVSGVHYKYGVHNLFMRNNGNGWVNVDKTVDRVDIQKRSITQASEAAARTESRIAAHGLNKAEVVEHYIVSKDKSITARKFDVSTTTVKNWYRAFLRNDL